MSRPTVIIGKEDPRRKMLESIAKEGLKPENLMVTVRGSENRKDVDCIEKYGLYFYVTGHVKDTPSYVFMGWKDSESVFTALKNTAEHARIGSLLSPSGDFVCDKMRSISDFEPDGSLLYFLTNDEMMNGAGVLLCDEVLVAIQKAIGNYWVAPSSVHELIIIPESACPLDREGVTEMVTAINGYAVTPEEKLVDNAFFFDGKLQ